MEWSSEFCRKRHHTGDLNEEQPLSKRLSLLNLNYGALNNVNNNTSRKRIKSSKKTPKQRAPAEQERMELDNVVYISDLDSDSESDADDKVVFLADIERKLSKIPYSLVNSDRPNDQPTSTELVLYSIPSSISVPEQKDVVRRAIIESRQRLRQKHAENAPNSVPSLTGSRDELKRFQSSGLNRALDEDSSVVSCGAWNGMHNGGTSELMKGGWQTWSSPAINASVRSTENFNDLDAMEIE